MINLFFLLSHLDVNDCPPTLPQDNYDVTVSESAPFGSVILKVTAQDNDGPGNWSSFFYIILFTCIWRSTWKLKTYSHFRLFVCFPRFLCKFRYELRDNVQHSDRKTQKFIGILPHWWKRGHGVFKGEKIIKCYMQKYSTFLFFSLIRNPWIMKLCNIIISLFVSVTKAAPR
jgi:hypothetical protein